MVRSSLLVIVDGFFQCPHPQVRRLRWSPRIRKKTLAALAASAAAISLSAAYRNEIHVAGRLEPFRVGASYTMITATGCSRMSALGAIPVMMEAVPGLVRTTDANLGSLLMV